jgi:hypothetical protein
MIWSSETIAGGGVKHGGGQKGETDGYKEDVQHIGAPYSGAEHREERI